MKGIVKVSKREPRTKVTMLAVSIEGRGPSLAAAFASVTEQMRRFVATAETRRPASRRLEPRSK